MFTDVNDDKAKIIKKHTKVLQNNKSDGSSSETETESKEEAAMNEKGARLTAFEELIEQQKPDCIVYVSKLLSQLTSV